METTKKKRRHPLLWIGLFLGFVLVLSLAGVIALPGILSSSWVQPRLIDAINPILKPGEISIRQFRFSWDKPLVLEGLQLRDKDGTVVIDSEEVTLDRNLWQLIHDPNDVGTMSFNHAVMDIRREEDGTINLVRALGSLITPKAGKDFAIVIRKSTLKVNAPQLYEPFVSHDADVLINLPKAPAPLSFMIEASSEGARKSRFALSVKGKVERWTDKSVDVLAEFDRWPIAGSGMGIGATAWAAGRVKINGGPDEYHIVPKIRSDVRWSDAENLPAWMTGIDRFQAQSDIRAKLEPTLSVSLKETLVTLPGVELALAGKAADLNGTAANVDIQGTLTVDSAKLKELTSKNSSEPLDLKISPITFAAKGPVSEKDRAKLVASLQTEIASLQTGGIKIGDMKLDAKWQDGKLAIAPIDTSINDGRLHIEPMIEMTPDGMPGKIRLGSRTSLARVSLDQITSQKYMVYPAPALASATRVSGFISAQILDGVIPLADKSQPFSLKGDMAFEDVRFGPGPWLLNLTQSVGLPPPPTFAITQPIDFEILGDRVIQHGLRVPIGELTQLDFSGTVTFKKELDLLVEVPVTPNLLQTVPLFQSFLGQESFKIPIRGTLDKPEVDQTAFDANMKKLGENLKNKAVESGLDMLFNGILGGRIPRPAPNQNGNPGPAK